MRDTAGNLTASRLSILSQPWLDCTPQAEGVIGDHVGRTPNILILMADQLTAGALPAYGNPVVKAPNIDKLAERGVVF